MFEVEYKTLDVTDSSNRFVSLAYTPVSSTNVAVDSIGGTAQAINSDFAVDGTKIKWDTTQYNLFFEPMNAGDVLRVIYDRS